MSERARVQRWRQRQREAGKEPLTIWLTTAEKLRLEDMALPQRCSPSELVQRMLAQWHGESLPVTDIVTDTEQLRALIQHELALAQTVTATVTDTVTVTVQQMLPALLRELLQEQQPGTVTAMVTDTVTDTHTSTGEDLRPDAAPERVADTVTVTDTDTVILPMTYPVTVATTDAVVMPMTASVTDAVSDTTTAPPAKRKTPLRQCSVTDTVADTITVTDPTLEPFDTTRYRLGKLCPKGHAFGGTGQSLLRQHNQRCRECENESRREKRQARRQEISQ